MKFDVVIGNPPYQRGTKENPEEKQIYKPAYAEFIEMALNTNSSLVSMIVPAKWFTDNQSSLARLRYLLKSEGHLKNLVDYKNSLECFENVRVAGGITYFLHDRNYKGDCEVVNISKGKRSEAVRDIVTEEHIIRDNIGVQILDKVRSVTSNYMSDYVESSVFKIKDNNKGYNVKYHDTDYEILSSENNSMAIKYLSYDDIQDNRKIADEDYKLVIGKLLAGGGDHPVDKNGMMKIISGIYKANPGQVFVTTYLMVMNSRDKQIIENCEKYIKTRFARFILYLGMAGLNFNSESFKYVPIQNFEESLDDEALYNKYGLSGIEREFINNFIKEIT